MQGDPLTGANAFSQTPQGHRPALASVATPRSVCSILSIQAIAEHKRTVRPVVQPMNIWSGYVD